LKTKTAHIHQSSMLAKERKENVRLRKREREKRVDDDKTFSIFFVAHTHQSSMRSISAISLSSENGEEVVVEL
jgi:hypothetical protein